MDEASGRAGIRCQCHLQAGFRAPASPRGVEPEPLSCVLEASGGHPAKIVRIGSCVVSPGGVALRSSIGPVMSRAAALPRACRGMEARSNPHLAWKE